MPKLTDLYRGPMLSTVEWSSTSQPSLRSTPTAVLFAGAPTSTSKVVQAGRESERVRERERERERERKRGERQQALLAHEARERET